MRIKRQKEMKDECCVMCESSLKWIVYNKSVRDTDRESALDKNKTLSKTKRPRGLVAEDKHVKTLEGW